MNRFTKSLLGYLLAAVLLLTVGCTATEVPSVTLTTTTAGTTTTTVAETTTTTTTVAETTTTTTTVAETTTTTETVQTTTSGETTTSVSQTQTTQSAPIPTTTTTAVTTTTVTVTQSTQYDISWHEEYSKLYDPQESEFDDEAAAMRNTMAALPDTVKAKEGGTTYYISNKGNDQNDGKSPATAFATVDPIRGGKLKYGDAVLFERGGLYRVTRSFYLVSGVSLGAYGTGNRPQIYGSKQNFADPAMWQDMGGNLWMLKTTFGSEVGVIVFNHGEEVGYWRETKAELTKNYDFWCNRSNGNITYVYLDKNPGEAFQSIEVAYDNNIFQGSNLQDVTLENLTIKYCMTGLFCQVSSKNVTVRGCEMGFLGGAVLEGYDFNNFTTRGGGGVAFMSNSENALVENCWFYHIYDTGVTYQGTGIAKNFIMRNNLVEFCGMASFEYWGTEAQGSLIEGNLMRFAGCGFGGIQRPDKHLRAHIQSNGKPEGAGYNKAANFVIRNNVFDQSAYQLINATSSAGSPPEFDGNTYVQVKNNRRRPLGYFKDITQLYFDANVAETIKNVLGDKNATVIYK